MARPAAGFADARGKPEAKLQHASRLPRRPPKVVADLVR
jgi:hypothetical protein